jgi:Bacterial RNA polymerase, alpha chain C terminal domain
MSIGNMEMPGEPFAHEPTPVHPPIYPTGPKTIDELDLPVRAYNVLKRNGVTAVGALTVMTREALLEFRNMGEKDAAGIEAKLRQHGLSLAALNPEDPEAVIDVEHITVYRWGALQVMVNGDGSVELSQRELDARAAQALYAICAKIAKTQAVAPVEVEEVVVP